MTAPTGHGHGHQAEQQFMPEAHFAVQAQQEEIDQLRVDVKHARDRLVYMRATLLQVQAEAQHQIGLKDGQIAQLEAELGELRKAATPDQHEEVEVEPDPADVRVSDGPKYEHEPVGEFDGPNFQRAS